MTNCLGLNVDKVAHDMNHPVAHYVKQELKFPSSFDTWHGMKRSLLLVSLYQLSSTSVSTWSLLTVSLHGLFYQSLSIRCLLPVSLYPMCSTCLSLPAVFYWSPSTRCVLSVSLYLINLCNVRGGRTGRAEGAIAPPLQNAR